MLPGVNGAAGEMALSSENAIPTAGWSQPARGAAMWYFSPEPRRSAPEARWSCSRLRAAPAARPRLPSVFSSLPSSASSRALAGASGMRSSAWALREHPDVHGGEAFRTVLDLELDALRGFELLHAARDDR